MNTTLFAQAINTLEVEDSTIVDFQKRTAAMKSIGEAQSLAAELKLRIDLCLETRCKDDLPFFYQFIAHCYVFFDKILGAENYAMMAIHNYRVCGMTWNEAIAHWSLGLIYRMKGRGYLYLSELNKALDIISPTCAEFLLDGKYIAAKNCEEIKKVLEDQRTIAARMGTGPLTMPDGHQKTNHIKAERAYMLVPWLPIYQSVRGGSQGIGWVDSPNDKFLEIGTVEFENTPHTLFPIKKTANNDFQITLNRAHSYGWAKVEGHSMSGAYPIPINDGDYVLFYINSSPEDGDIVIASKPSATQDWAFMVKRYKMAEKILASEPDVTKPGGDFSPVSISQEHQILGVVIAVAKAGK